MEDRVEEEFPGRGPHAGIQLEAAQREVLQGGGQAVGDARRLVGTRYLREDVQAM